MRPRIIFSRSYLFRSRSNNIRLIFSLPGRHGRLPGPARPGRRPRRPLRLNGVSRADPQRGSCPHCGSPLHYIVRACSSTALRKCDRARCADSFAFSCTLERMRRAKVSAHLARYFAVGVEPTREPKDSRNQEAIWLGALITQPCQNCADILALWCLMRGTKAQGCRHTFQLSTF